MWITLLITEYFGLFHIFLIVDNSSPFFPHFFHHSTKIVQIAIFIIIIDKMSQNASVNFGACSFKESIKWYQQPFPEGFLMFNPLPRVKKPVLIALLLFLVLSVGITWGCLRSHVFSENAQFEKYAEEIFREEVTASTLNLHYSLAYPQKQRISIPKATLGTVNTDMESTYQLCRTREKKLQSFSYSKLSIENQLAVDSLLLYFHTQRSLGDQYLLEEVLGPSLGIQAQLPVLLAEYPFYSNQDISDYLSLLCDVPAYFKSILAFEEKKAAAGTFMSDTTLDRILEQCRAFIQNPDSNYMLEIFEEKLKEYGKLSQSDQETMCQTHRDILLKKVIPAYQDLMNGLEALRGRGKSSRGLAHFPGGRQYYLYLLHSKVGSFTPVEKMEKRLTSQLLEDSRQISLMLREQPSLLTKLKKDLPFQLEDPTQMLQALQQDSTADFPSLKKTDYQLKYVHKSMENFLSPAFYLTPPLDTGSPNIIYLNPTHTDASLELFTLLGHEGFPGHLYQLVSFGRTRPSHIRYLLDWGGYTEGWATYAESYAYEYAASYIDDPAASDLAHISWLNRSVNLCLYSLLDIGIHYRGWSMSQVSSFLAVFGITKEETISEIYQYIVETPANYLRYYWGYLNFLDLKKAYQKKSGDDFDIKEFHRKIIEIGSVPFPVLEKYLLR